MRIVLATTNPAKMARLEWLVSDLPGLEPVRPAPLSIAEGMHSFRENAVLKARAYAATHAMPSIATDGGLVIPALGAAWNPVLTGRRSADLLHLMCGLRGEQRHAVQSECVAVVDESGTELAVLEVTSGRRSVAPSFDPRGLQPGFWLPGLLLYGPDEKPYADLSPTERNLAEDHWLVLRDRLRPLLVAELTRRAAPASRAPRS